jgi:3-carboxy-cis,cis-muconate cycloisomerase
VSSLFWPGDDRADGVFADGNLRSSMLVVESAWAAVLQDAGISPPAARVYFTELTSEADNEPLARAAERSGNPVVPFVELLRERLRARGDAVAADWVHRGLTSQDVVDTAMVLECQHAVRLLRQRILTPLVTSVVGLADRHRTTAMTGRTLTQPAVPIRFGAKVAGWLHGVLDAAEDVDRLTFPVQVGGAAGTLSGVVVLTGGDTRRALDLVEAFATKLQLTARAPWHTDRAPLTRIGEAFTRVTAACGRIANDVLTLSRPEIGELTEGDGGGSSTMPQKQNPVLSTLVRRAALAAPSHLSLLHLAAADTADERPAGAWHLEWEPLALLARHTLTAVDQTATLVAGLQVDPHRMAANLAAAAGVDAERVALGRLAGALPDTSWAGADDLLVDAATARARTWLGAA